jgi:kynureninase
MGAADPFRMGPAYEPAAGIRRFISGTPAVVGMLAMRDMVALIEEAGIQAVRAKSTDLTAYVVDLAEAWLRPLGVTIGSPRDPARRGGHVTLNHPSMRAVTTALWDQEVLPDYRDPDGLRVGLSPLSTSFDEVRRGVEAVRDTLSRIGA